MSRATRSFVAYDNPSTLTELASNYIIRNIKKFTNGEIIYNNEFVLWKDGITLSDAILEQLFQAILNNWKLGSIPTSYSTLFIGSRQRTHQFITSLVSPPALGDITGNVCYILLRD